MPELAIGAVDLIALFVAVVVLIILFAGNYLVKPVTHALRSATSGIPVVGRVGDYIAGLIEAGMSVAVTALRATWDPKVTWAAHAIWGVAAGPWHWVYKVTQALGSLFAQLSALAQKVAQLAVNTFALVADEIAAVKAFAYGLALQAIATAEQYALAAAQVVLHEAQHLYNLAISALTAAETTLVHEMQHLYNQAIAYANHVLGLAEDFAVAQADDVRSEAVTLFGQAEHAIAGVQSEVQALGGDITGIQTEINPLLGALPIIASIPLLESLVQSIATDVTDCLDPLCNTVTPNANELGDLGKLLKGLEGLAELGLLGALVTAAVADPKAAATGVVDATRWLTTLGVDLADAAGAAL